MRMNWSVMQGGSNIYKRVDVIFMTFKIVLVNIDFI